MHKILEKNKLNLTLLNTVNSDEPLDFFKKDKLISNNVKFLNL